MMSRTKPGRCRRGLAITAVLLACVTATPSGRAEETVLRMPDYGRGTPPPPRSRAEVEAVLAGAAEREADERPLHVVLVAGPKDHGPGEHDYPAWQTVWAELLARSAAPTRVSTAWEFPEQEVWETADVVVFYQRGRWDAHRAAVVDPFLARGGGLVYIHWAVDGREDVPGFAQRIGLAAKGGGGIRVRHGALEVDFTPGAEHPIARNLDRVHWVDESYWNLTGDPRRIELLGTGIEEDQPRPLFWTLEQGRGRVFVSIPGHYAWTFDDPLFRIVLLRGIAWAGHREVDRFRELATEDARVADSP